MISHQGVLAALHDAQKQTQGDSQNKETKKYDPNERTDQNSRKRTKRKEISNLSDAEFKTLFIRMLKELIEDLNSIKRIQSEMKDTLIKVKNNLQGINSRVDEAEDHINDLEHMKPKHNPS